MLTAEGCTRRRRRLWEALPSPCDVLVLGDPQHLVYFANYAPSSFTFRTNDAGALLILQPDRATLVGDNLLQPFLEQAHVDEVVAPVWYDAKRSASLRQALLVQSALEVLRSRPGGRLGIELSSVPAGLVEGLRAARSGLALVDLEPLIRGLRRSKDSDEVAVLRRAIQAGEAGFAAALERLAPGMSEFEAYLFIQRAALESAGDRAIVYGDFDAGPRGAAIPGPPSQQRILRPGDLFVLDFSVIVHGYRGDFANTIAVGGEVSPENRRRSEGCVAALAAGETMLRPGTPARDVDAAVRKALASAGLDPDFPSHSGHGIGLSHPEPPFLVPESDDTLQAGDVVTLEPGQYGSGYAMRFERNYLITADGFETLTHHRLALT
jgi:Xaa-Pro aminopeptidase